MSVWEKRRNFLFLAGLVALHILLISIQVPRGAEKSLFERSVFFLFSPVQRAVTGTVRESARSGMATSTCAASGRRTKNSRKKFSSSIRRSVFWRTGCNTSGPRPSSGRAWPSSRRASSGPCHRPRQRQSLPVPGPRQGQSRRRPQGHGRLRPFREPRRADD